MGSLLTSPELLGNSSLLEKNCGSDSISQHIAEIEDESLEVYFVVLHTQSVIQETHHKRINESG
jgi:hypothetical protein